MIKTWSCGGPEITINMTMTHSQKQRGDKTSKTKRTTNCEGGGGGNTHDQVGKTELYLPTQFPMLAHQDHIHNTLILSKLFSPSSHTLVHSLSTRKQRGSMKAFRPAISLATFLSSPLDNENPDWKKKVQPIWRISSVINEISTDLLSSKPIPTSDLKCDSRSKTIKRYNFH